MSDKDTPSPKENQQNNILLHRPTNERVLCTAFASFMGFATAQTFAAIIAGSQAMVGDSAAMMVDAFTYLFNWYAERQKQGYVEQLRVQNGGMSKLLYRKYTYQLELVTPLLSVSTLIVVTVLVLKKAIHVLILDARRDRSQQTNPNLQLMILFSFLNLLLDVFNVFLFARAKHAMGYQTTMEEDMEDENTDHVQTMRSLLSYDEYGSRGEEDIKGKSNRKTKSMVSLEIESSGSEDEADDHGSNPLCWQQNREDGSNLNMCSAYTHVFADTLRSIAVIVASLLAEFLPSVTPEEADAAAAVIVSVLIVLSLVPLCAGMKQTFEALKRVEVLLQEEELQSGYDYDDEEEEGSFV